MSVKEMKRRTLRRADRYSFGDRHNAQKLSFQANFACRANGSLSVGVTWEKAYSVHDTEGILSWNLYF